MDRAKVQPGLLRLWIFYREDDALVKTPGQAVSKEFSTSGANIDIPLFLDSYRSVFQLI